MAKKLRDQLKKQFLTEARTAAGDMSYGDIMDAIRRQLQELLKPKDGSDLDYYCYVADVFPGFFVYQAKDGSYVKRSWSQMDGVITIGDTDTPVERAWVETAKEAWIDALGESGRTQETVSEELADLPAPDEVPTDAAEVTEATSLDGLGMETATVNGLEVPVIRGVTILQEGTSKNGRSYSAGVLTSDGPRVFEGARCFVTNHDQKEKNVRNLVGQFRNVSFAPGTAAEATGAGTPGRLIGDLYGLPSDAGILRKCLEATSLFGPDTVGVSINTPARSTPQRTGGVTTQVVERIYRSRKTSGDIVVDPSAGGAFPVTEMVEEPDMKLAHIAALSAAALAAMNPAAVKAFCGDAKREEISEVNAALAPLIFEKLDAKDDVSDPKAKLVTEKTEDDLDARVERMLAARDRKATLDRILAEAKDLPAGVVTMVRESFEAKEDWAEADLAARVKGLREEVGRSRPRVPGSSVIFANEGVSQDDWDLKKLRLEGFFRGHGIKDKTGTVIEPYHSFRYEVLREMAGVDPYALSQGSALNRILMEMSGGGDRLELGEWVREDIQDNTFANAWADVMYRVLLDSARLPVWNSWQRWCKTVPFLDLTNPRKFNRIGGYGDIPTVLQNGAYQPLTTPGEEHVQFSIVKKGGTEEVTWEATLNDDVRLIAGIPTRLGTAWARTVHNIVYQTLQDNSGAGPVLSYDSKNLYASNRATGLASNIVDGALSRANLTSARKIMKKQQELSSGKRLALSPRFVLVASPDLDDTIWELTSSDRKNTTNEDSTIPNFFGPGGAGGGIDPIMVVYPTDTTQRWELLADPNDIDLMFVGFLNGRFDPDILLQDDERQGARFTTDRSTYKIRGTVGATPADHRGFVRGQNN